MSDAGDPFLTPRSRPLTTASSADNLRDDPFVPPNPQFSRDSAYGLQPSLNSTPRASAVGEPNTNSYYDTPVGSNSNNQIPLLDQDGSYGTPRGDAGKEYDPYADRSAGLYGSGKKSLLKRPIFWAGMVVLIVVVVAAVILPVYFVVIKPNNNNSSAAGAASNNNGNSTGGNSTSGGNNGGQKVLITGGDGTTITKDDGTTFVYNNTLGGFCELVFIIFNLAVLQSIFLRVSRS